MNLTPGQRLIGGERSAYDVLGPAFEVPEYHFYRARKIFWNLRPTDPILYEADSDECLDVLLRVAIGPGPRSLRFELDSVLSIPDAPGLPLPVDALETPDGPVLVLADLPGTPIALGPVADSVILARRVRILREIMELFAAFHRRDLVTGGLDLGDLRVEESGRWWFLGTYRVAPTWTPAMLADDLTSWWSLAYDLLFGRRPTSGPEEKPPALDGPEVAALADTLAGPDRDGFRWVIARLGRSFEGPPEARPTSAIDLIRGPIASPGAIGALRSAFGSLGQRLRGESRQGRSRGSAAGGPD